VEDGLPTLDEAQRLIIEEIKQAKGAGARVLKVIHGYGSSVRGVQKKGSLVG
jgi:DNA-nicking Smr family endonuclease